MNQFIFKEDENGNFISYINPEYKKEVMKEAFEFRLGKSGIPREYHKYNLDNVHGFDDKTLAIAKKYIDSFENNEDLSLYFVGERNSGKTSLACVIGQEILKKGFNVSFAEFHYLQDCFIKNQGFTKDDEITSYLSKLKKSDLIIIDDCYDPSKSVFWKNSNHLIVSEWNYFVRSCISNGKKFIKTSNIHIKQIKEYYGDDIYSMLSAERGKFKEYNIVNSEIENKRQDRLKVLN